MKDQNVFSIITAMTVGVMPKMAYELDIDTLKGLIKKQSRSKNALVMRKKSKDEIEAEFPNYLAGNVEPKDDIGDVVMKEISRRDNKIGIYEQNAAKTYFVNDFNRAVDFAESYIDQAEWYIFNDDKVSKYLPKISGLILRAKQDLDRIAQVTSIDVPHVRIKRLDAQPMVDRLKACFQRYHAIAEDPDELRIRMYNDFLEEEIQAMQYMVDDAIKNRKMPLARHYKNNMNELIPGYAGKRFEKPKLKVESK